MCSCFSLDFFLVSFCLWLVFGVCVVVLWVWWGMGKDRRRKRLLLLLFFFTLPCVGIVCGEEWGREDFCVRGICGVCRQACAWGIVYCRPVFGVFCGLLARFLVPIGCLYVFSEKVPQNGFLEALAIFCRFYWFCLSSSHFVALFRMGAAYVLYSHPC